MLFLVRVRAFNGRNVAMQIHSDWQRRAPDEQLFLGLALNFLAFDCSTAVMSYVAPVRGAAP